MTCRGNYFSVTCVLRNEQDDDNSAPLLGVTRKFIMQTFVQVKDVIDYSKMIHVRLRNVYESINEINQSEQVKMFLDYLIAEQHRSEELLSTFEATSQPSLLDNWMQYSPSIDIHKLIDEQQINPGMTLDEVAQLAVRYSEAMIAFYLEAANETDLPKVSSVFQNLAEMERKDNLKQGRVASFKEM